MVIARFICAALLVLASAFCLSRARALAAPELAPQSNSSSAEKFLIAGTLLHKDGLPAPRKTVFFFFMQDGVAYAKLGLQAGVIKVVSPSGKSDIKGRFTIEVDPALIKEWRAISTAFTIGFLDENRQPLPLTRNGVPITVNFDDQGKSKKVDLGEITVDLK